MGDEVELNTRNKRLVSLAMSGIIAAGSFGAVIPASAAAPVIAAGTPYDASGYNVNVKHVEIYQYYGSGVSTGGAADYGFIELYNPTDAAVDLGNWSIQYADRMNQYNASADPALPLSGATGPWEKLDLTGSIPAHGSYLIRAASSLSPSTKLSVKTGDINFTRDHAEYTLQNKGMKVVLMSNQTLLDATNVNPSANTPKTAGFVDMLGAAGNDTGSTIDGYEGSDYPKEAGGPSKNISLRRVDFNDSDDNKNDFALIDYKGTAGAAATYGPHSSADGSWGPSTPVTPPVATPVSISTASLPDATKTLAYSASVAATGGTAPYAYSATGLPKGLSINDSTGAITGTPADDAASANTAAITVTDSAPGTPGTVTKSLTINVNPMFQDSVSITKLGSFIAGTPNADGGVAEIVKYNTDNHKFYSVNGSSDPATLDIVSLDANGVPIQQANKINIEQTIADHVPNFAYGDFTSVDIDTKHDLVYAAIQESDYTKNGIILVFDYDGNFVKYYEAGVQPDMVKVTKDGSYVLTADEAEGRSTVDPEGSVTIVDTVNNTVKHVKFDNPSVIDDAVHLRGLATNGVITGPATSKDAAVYDLEPEYIALSADEATAYVSLQEGNAIGTINIAQGTVTSVKGLGYKDLNDPANSLDLVKDNAIKFENVPFKGMYMPDGIDTYTVDGNTYLFTANEGDSTDWPGARTNVSTIGAMKGSLTPGSAAATFLANNTVNGKTPYDGVEVPSDMGPDGIYLYGARSFSVWNPATMEQIYDSHNDFEKITAQRLPAYFNSNHADVSFDKRSPKKGPEPEYVKVGKVGNKAFAFIGLERISGIMTYDVTDPTKPVFANYINTRDFTAAGAGSLPPQTDTGPEGIDFIPASASPTGLPLILVANEVGGTVTVLQMNVTKVTLDKTSLTIASGSASKKLVATVQPVGNGAATATWSSSNTAVARVDANGNVSPRSQGTAVITAISADGYGMAEATVKVTASSVPGETPGTPSIPGTPTDSGTPTDPGTPTNPGQTGNNGSSNEQGTTVTTEVKTTTDSSGQATAAVTGEQIEEALSKLNAGTGNKVVEIKAIADSNATKNTITLPATALSQLASSTVNAVTIDAGLARVTLDGKALDTISKSATSGDVSISAAKVDLADLTANLSPSAQASVTAAIGSHPVYSFTVLADGKKVSDFAGGEASVSVPYTPAPGENMNAIIMYYLADNGDIAMVPEANYDPVTGMLSFTVKHFSTYAVGYNETKFSDIASSFAKDQIIYLSARNIIKGTSASSFAPKANVTRADFTLILARAAGVDLAAYGGSGFSDVSSDAYYAKSVAWAAANGITSGVSAKAFDPSANITREQMVTMIARFADKLQYKLPALTHGATFADASSISAYAQQAAMAVQQAGIINGKPNGSQTLFAPKQFATREETAKMIAILFQLMTK
ncbi:hypothetical protein GZH47_12500 [Paenibacillus rhizovicinus]|uniref:S-layer homology domain-containing protein n=1 Tax=Paenibacillus rhizovicinus TaxID=2704463 RepID=A0A6C0NZC8_9BACL|nr:choice-of-anchor I family protein [Paenibacillus rhizovicinus]QHW31578.1 hypothetical protein GZH47_12500 [Paenibacillus rhizovicinus]